MFRRTGGRRTLRKVPSQAEKILNAKDRIPYGSIRGKYVYNFWQDAEHVRGIMRRTTPESYRLAKPEWETVLDIDALAKAAANNRQLRFNYRKPGAPEAEPRVVDPYHLANINSEWFLFAHCHLRNDIRTFTPARIKGMVETGVTFEPPEGFSLEERLRGSFAIVTGDSEQEITIRFNELVADYIREKKWHPTQQQRDLEDGGVELTMHLTSLSEVQRWVMTWCGNAQVIRPPELAKSVKEAAEKIVETSRQE